MMPDWDRWSSHHPVSFTCRNITVPHWWAGRPAVVNELRENNSVCTVSPLKMPCPHRWHTSCPTLNTKTDRTFSAIAQSATKTNVLLGFVISTVWVQLPSKDSQIITAWKLCASSWIFNIYSNKRGIHYVDNVQSMDKCFIYIFSY